MGRSFSPGALIDGKYTVEAVLGRGGMGTVVRARHEILRQSVAIKLPAAEFGEHPEVVQRLLREARAAASLKSEHVCRVLDVGLADNNLPYIVMELLEGADLMQVLRKRERISPACACAVIIDVCDALAEAHAMGIVHRDVKPQNIFIAHRARKHPLVKVLDFGISKVHVSKLSGEHMSLTNTSALLGTPSYISPEQIVSTRDVDLRADIWALGVCLYQAMTGKLPFRGSGIMDVAVRISSETVKPPRQHVREIPVSVERVILRCLEKDPAQRYPDVDALVEAIRAAITLDGTELNELAGAISAVTPAGPAPSHESRVEEAPLSAQPTEGIDATRTSTPPAEAAPARLSAPPAAALQIHARQPAVTESSWFAPGATRSSRRTLPFVALLVAVAGLVFFVVQRIDAARVPRSTTGETSAALAPAAPPVSANEPVPPSAEPLLPSPVAAAPSAHPAASVVRRRVTGRPRPLGKPSATIDDIPRVR